MREMHLQPMVRSYNSRVVFRHVQTTIFNLELYPSSSCNSCVAYVVHKRSLRRGTAEMANGAKKDPVARVAAVATT